ncbi:heme oxygenase (staphylobilin-producing) [Paenibacillus shirakamiensis]|uniref:Heme oxygenase (Staphylobilin-producing) n=1 Tax=Paenibacillus shirakamiensis TaxID=1265935 RepID=A0ABS4JLC8_9BACL|nr:antibiotic biosynthesis monooxygenase [Paenibacillus shirakamiensis]MBP2001886.1 heme oxygenase (staphylobilin-producing) [Paenibacillus shirakamiensis]
MLVVTNTIKVKEGYGQQIATRFAEAKGVQTMPGFIRLEVWLNQEAKDGAEELKVTTLWENEESFKQWTSSEAFRESHRGGGESREYMLGASLDKYERVVSHTAE